MAMQSMRREDHDMNDAEKPAIVQVLENYQQQINNVELMVTNVQKQVDTVFNTELGHFAFLVIWLIVLTILQIKTIRRLK